MHLFPTIILALATIVIGSHAFTISSSARTTAASASRSENLILKASSSVSSQLFADETEMIPIAKNYVRAKYRQVIKSHDHQVMDKQDAREVLRTLLPPVTPEELDEEVDKTLKALAKSAGSNAEEIKEDDFVEAVIQNTYWAEAGDLVVKELMYFDALYNYYCDEKAEPLLNNEDYEEVKENLEWEGSSVPRMNKKEALFVTAVASSRRGDSIMSDDEYLELKRDLVQEGSWVTKRAPDGLEKIGLQTFLGYLHRALKK